MSIVGIWSEKNNLKHFMTGTQSMSKPSTADGFGNFISSSTIIHNLGYRPLVRAYYDPDGNGTYYPLIGQNAGFGGMASDSPLATVVPFVFYTNEVTDTLVTFRCWDTASNAGNFNYYYRVYIDPAL